MQKIFLVRHAESIANKKGIYQGQTYDTGLSERGQQQALALSTALKDENIDQILVSPLKRTVETALPLSQKKGIKMTTTSDLLETNHGIWEGKTKKWVNDNYPDILKTWLTNPKDAVFPGGESFENTISRVKQFLNTQKFTKQSVIITHDNIVRIIICLILGEPINNMWSLPVNQAAINTLQLDGKLTVEKLNYTAHLGPLSSDLSKHAL